MEEQVYYCKVCNKEIHPKRAALGYKTTCVEHSEAKKFTGLIVTEGEESHEVSSVQIIRDPKLAAELERLKSSAQPPDIY
jgi:hypothetical protein